MAPKFFYYTNIDGKMAVFNPEYIVGIEPYADSENKIFLRITLSTGDIIFAEEELEIFVDELTDFLYTEEE